MPMRSTDVWKSRGSEEALKHEEIYEWLEAANSYEKIIEAGQKTEASPSEIWERIGFCYSLASRQRENIEDFKRLCLLAVEAYEQAADLLEKEDSDKNRGRIAHCKANAALASSWTSSSPSDKRAMLDECRRLGKECIEEYERNNDRIGAAKASSDMLSCLLDRLYISSDWREMRSLAQEGTALINKAVPLLLNLGEETELLRAYFLASLHSWYVANFCEQNQKAQKEIIQKSSAYAEESLKLSREIDNPYYGAMSNWAAAYCTLVFTEKVDSALDCAKEMLRQGTIVRDNYLKGIAYYLLAFATDWKMLREADPDRKTKGYREIMQYGENAVRHLQLVAQDFFIAETYLFYAESCSALAMDVDASSEEKRAMLEKAVEIGREGLEHANRSGSADATCSTLHALSKALHFFSSIEPDQGEKARLLKEALSHREEFVKIMDRAFPSNDWVCGVNKNYEGLIRVDLARLETDRDEKKKLLEGAIEGMKDGVSRAKKWALSRPVPAQIAAVGAYEDSLGGTLIELYLLTREKRTLLSATDAYGDAANHFKKVGMPSRVAESYWKIARNQDWIGNRQKSAENFDSAFAEYKVAAQKIPGFADFFLDYAGYMNAWSEVEKAKLAHDREEYAGAMKHYEKVAGLLKPSELWGHLSSNFMAWSILEHAEDLSRREESGESMDAFRKAAALFEEAGEAFQQVLGRIQNVDEREKTVELCKASVQRKDYCLARVNMEQARIHDRRGEHAESATSYDAAADIFERMMDAAETASDRKEIELIDCMCRAWEKMKIADGRDSAEIYHEASELFLKAKACSTVDKASLLAAGNSAFCEALEHGTRFATTREKEEFARAKQHLASAANYYLKAGFDNASVWTNATEIQLEAYNYMITADTETDPEKKTKAYLLAEKCLAQSAQLFERAGYVGKKDETLKTLESVKEKHEFIMSLDDVLAAPGDASSTRAIAAPGLTVEEPVGLSKFERELIQANLIAHKKEIVVGENFDLEVQLANLGKNAAFLSRVEEIVPAGLDLVEKPEKCVAEDGLLNFRGRKLAPLETMEMKLALKARKKGKYVFTPRLQYMSETGEHKSCELEQVTLVVKELGIRGWLRGSG
jgi:hypothetical protein